VFMLMWRGIVQTGAHQIERWMSGGRRAIKFERGRKGLQGLRQVWGADETRLAIGTRE
jgi:hypothetical protein